MQKEILLCGNSSRNPSLGTSCSDCIANKRISRRQTRPKKLSNTEFTMGPEDWLKLDILPNIPSSIGYKHIITNMDVFSCYLFAYPTQDMTARTVGRSTIDVMTRHYYLPKVILAHKGSQFRSEVVIQIATTLDIRKKPLIYETCSNNRHFREIACIFEDFIENINGSATVNVA